ncbi:hypothetical protein scyTo_0012821 [Scyliorhinus torazame]|uniref:Uncharacterized protein n=1 Tax=Scyliorhinus torazame TaxID=75743 RepID=A0A401NJA4_SCYTO|nr:hypothetical protein [Scyliorhinus torazame]
MQENVGREQREASKTRSIGELVLPGGPVGEVRQVSKVNPTKQKEQEGLKRTSVAVLKYNPALAKSRQGDRRKSSAKKGSSKDIAESRLWSSIDGGTEVYFSGHAIRHIQPRSQSAPDTRLDSATNTNQLRTTPQWETSTMQTPAPMPQPWPPVKKPDTEKQHIKVYKGRWRCLHYLCDQICCKPRMKTTILYE